jgi:GTP-binding protein
MNYSTPKFNKTQDLDALIKIYRTAIFDKSAAKIQQLPPDEGHEVAIVGRSNAGKSTFLNTLTGQKSLAKTSKTPGRTQLMNVFNLAIPQKRIVDLPGYGFAKVAQSTRFDWEKHLEEYFTHRQSLQGVVVLMDIRHPLQDLDHMMIANLVMLQLPIYILLTKADKLSKNAANMTLNKVKQELSTIGLSHQIQKFSIQQPETLVQVVDVLNEWLGISEKN